MKQNVPIVAVGVLAYGKLTVREKLRVQANYKSLLMLDFRLAALEA